MTQPTLREQLEAEQRARYVLELQAIRDKQLAAVIIGLVFILSGLWLLGLVVTSETLNSSDQALRLAIICLPFVAAYVIAAYRVSKKETAALAEYDAKRNQLKK